MSDRPEPTRANCTHRREDRGRVASGGWWFNREWCPQCHRIFTWPDREVDQSSDLDCAAADASQGIV